MFKITFPDGKTVLTEKPNFIRMHTNNCYILCPREKSEGIAYHGGPYLYKDGAMVHEVDCGDELAALDSVTSIAFVTLAEGGSIDDTTAAEHADMFAAWAYPVAYTAGQIRRHTDGKLYKCLTGHTSQEDWTPDAAPSLWVSISDPADEWPAWSQPVGSTDAYAKGAKVSHSGTHWTSDLDNNVWEPGVYGWTEVADN